ncbi:MAG TPA: cupredoxin domain-containing protein [Sphingomicrobium sp.]|nr:cupredoxin domain-containing protein [Sphingomicrobium sp.]
MNRFGKCAGVAAAALVLVLLPSPASAAPHMYTLVIEKMRYGAAPAELHKGDSILWLNRDFLRHTATAADRSFDVDLPPGAKAKTVMLKSGSITFACRYHPGMRGVLQVK